MMPKLGESLAVLLRYLCFIVLLANTANAYAAPRDIDRERLNPLLSSILKVEAVTDAGGYSLGTAVSIAPGKFVTSCHVTARSSRIDLLYEGLRWPVMSQSSDSLHDACLLNVPSLERVAPVKRRSAAGIKVGQDVVAMGYTFGAGLMAQTGVISALHPLDGSAVIQTSTPFNSGASGGGLFDADGALIGILTFRLPGAIGFYFSIPTDWIASRIDDSESYVAVAPLEGPRPFWAQPKESLPYFMRATTLQATGDWQGVIQLTDEWMEADSHNVEPWMVRGNAYERIDRIEAAIKAYRAAVQRAPALGAAWFSLGEACARGGHRAEVIEALTHLRTIDPELADDLAVRSGIAK